MKITVVGLGYVGLANAAMLAREHDVIGLDIDPERVLTVNSGHSTVPEQELDDWLNTQPLRLWATDDRKIALRARDYIVIAVPTSYDESTGDFDTSIVERVIDDALLYSHNATIVIRSTVPIGFTSRMIAKYRLSSERIIFVPEFLREGSALLDTLHPSRIIIGGHETGFGKLLNVYSGEGIIQMLPEEAEAVKLFSNTYLAMRVAFFNELDSFAAVHDLSTRNIINGVSGDPRIGHGYNNPSFGYGGYCLPKDTKQLRSNYKNIPETLISAIVDSNEKRKAFIAANILMRTDGPVGIYRLTMKSGSGNWRDSAVIGVIERLKMVNVEVLIYEPELAEDTFLGAKVLGDLDEFTARSELIVANRDDDRLAHVQAKVYTRDIFKTG